MRLDPVKFTTSLLLARSARYVKRGQSGDSVRSLQNALNYLGYTVSADGQFGPETEKALREFQSRTGAKVDGIVGRETFGKLTRAEKRAAKPRTNVNPADIGLDVLGETVGAHVKGVTGRPRGFGTQPGSRRGSSGTTGSVGTGSSGSAGTSGRSTRSRASRGSTAAPKGAHGGTVDATGHEVASAKTGPIGSTTPKSASEVLKEGKVGQSGAAGGDFNSKHPRGLPGTPEGGQFVKKGDSGTSVSIAQDALNKNGAKLKKDGKFGAKTEQAVKDFQQKRGLQVDGVIGIHTTRALIAAARGTPG